MAITEADITPEIQEMTDELCHAVIVGLDNADFDVSSFEASFIESNLDRKHFSDKQKVVIDRLIKKYAGKFEY